MSTWEIYSSLVDVACLLPWEQLLWAYWTTFFIDTTGDESHQYHEMCKTLPARLLAKSLQTEDFR